MSRLFSGHPSAGDYTTKIAPRNRNAIVKQIQSGSIVANSTSGKEKETVTEAVDVTKNTIDNDSPIPVIYGQRVVGGVTVLAETTGSSNENLNIVLSMAEGEINSFENIYIDDKLLSTFGSSATVYTHTGTDAQTADSNLVSEVTGWTTDHKLSGTAYVYAKLVYSKNAFSSGLPKITADIKGVKVYDPRTATTAWSDNPALCIRDYLTNARYGRGIDTSLIDDTAFISAANFCEETVTLGGETVARYTCNGFVDTSAGTMGNLSGLLTSCRGFLVFTGGKYKLVIDKAETPAFTFSEDNLIGDWTIHLGTKDSQFNKVKASFFNKDKDWKVDNASIDSATLKTQDNGILLEKAIELPFTSDIDRAKMITTINLNQSRQQILVEFKATIEALKCEIGDVVYIKHATTGWDTLNTNQGKKFRVMRVRLHANDEVTVVAMEYDDDSFDFGTIATSDTAPNTNLPDLTTVISPTAVAVSESLYSTIGSAGVKARMTIAWNASADIFVEKYEVEYRKTSESDYTFLTSTRALTARVDDVDPDVYDVRVRAINTMGVSSDFTLLSNTTIQGLTTPPVDVDGLSLVALGGYAHLSWDLATDLDVKIGGKVRFRHSNLTVGGAWESSTDIGSAVNGHVTTAVLPLLTGTYMAKFVDSSGNESINVSSFVSSTVPDIIKMNAVATSDQHPNFAGVKTDMFADTFGGALKFEADTLWDDFSGDIDTWIELDAMGGLDKSGSYEFDNYIDLGQTFTSRVTAEIAFTAYTLGDYIDDRTTYIDDWIDFDNIPSDVNVNLYVASTTDNPASSPTWTEWAKFTVADYSARALKFKLTATSADALHQIDITRLCVSVDMPDRVQGANGIQTGASTTDVTYSQPFFATPSVGVTFADMATSEVVEITNESSAGFTVGATDGSSYSDRKFNWVARGY